MSCLEHRQYELAAAMAQQCVWCENMHLRAEVARLLDIQVQRDAAVASELAWEQRFMDIVGEDGVDSAGNAVLTLQADNEWLTKELKMVESVRTDLRLIGYRKDAQIDRLTKELAEALKLAYIGEHHLPGLTYKARFEEALNDLRAEREAHAIAKQGVAL